MSMKDRLKAAQPIQGRLDWMQKGDPNVLSVRIEDGNVDIAAETLERHAVLRGLRIVEVARFTHGNVDAAFARGVTNAA